MDNQVHNAIVSFIWGIADDCLRDVYVRGKYRDVILPMTVIRRLDAMLEDTKPAVLEMKEKLDKAGITNQWPALCNAAGQAFCNSSPFLLKDLTSRAKKQTLKVDFEAYLDGFSPNVQEILEKFKFRNQIDTMIDADILGAVIEKFVSPTINLSPKPVYTDDTMKTIKLPALDNHGMGTIFEELIRKFNEENNEEAGEHWTPRDVVDLMADLVIIPVADKIMDATYSCYDGACGTGGMLTVAQDRLMTVAKKRGKEVSIHLFGQELQPETYAICKADMLLKGDGEQAEHIAYGSTLSADGNASRQFDFMLANPPYGKSWKTDAEKMGGKKDILDSRFVAYLEDGTQLSMIPRTSDGQLLFLLNNVSKMKTDTPLGSRIAEVHNASSLFTGDAGSGESNARRFLFESDLVEAIIALPENMFYNTKLATYIWVLSNKKEPRRVRVDDFVISLRSFQGGIERAYYQGIISPAYTVMIPRGISVQYFKHLAKSRVFIELLQQCVTGIREGQNVDYEILKSVRIPVPPIEEQLKIAEYLDSIDARIDARKKEIKLLEKYKAAISSDIVMGRVDIRNTVIPAIDNCGDDDWGDEQENEVSGDEEV